MGNMLRSKRNHRPHTECDYGCCTNDEPAKVYRVREKREAARLIREARNVG